MGYTLRKLVEADIEHILDMFLKTYAEAPWSENWDQSFARERLRDFIGSDLYLNFGAADDSLALRAVLFGRRNYYREKKELFVDELFVDSGFHGRGLGSFLLDAVAEAVKSEGYSCIVLNTEKGYPAEAFYKRNGFTQQNNNIFMYKNI